MYSTWKQTVPTKDGKTTEITGFHGVGNLTGDFELRKTNSGKSVTGGASLAINSFVNGEKKAEFFRLDAWEKTAELFTKYASKGRQVEIIGTLSVKKNEGKDGKTYENEVVTIQRFNWLGGKTEGAQSTGSVSADSSYEDMTPVDDSDIPF